MNVAESLLTALRDHGARQVFGIPGDFVLTLSQGHRGIRDPAAAHAEPRALDRLRGRRGGAGRGLDPAWPSSRTAQARSTWSIRGRGLRREVTGGGRFRRARAARRPRRAAAASPGEAARLGKYANLSRDHLRPGVAARCASAPADVARVLRSCLTQSRPVYVELPRDMVLAQCAPVQRLPAVEFDPAAVAACVTRSWTASSGRSVRS